MNKQETIELYAELINMGISDADIFIDYRGELNAEEFAVYIKEAETVAYQERLKTFPPIYKRKYYISISCLVASIIMFFIVIPTCNIVEFVTFISIIGSFCIVFSAAFVLIFRKRWLPSSLIHRRTKNFDYTSLFVLSLIPVVILTFIIYLIIESGAYHTLKNTQEEVMGTVIDGLSRETKSRRGGLFDETFVVVEFTTKSGKRMVVKKDVSSYQFKDFYKGQELELIYSRENPKNIDLLIDKSAVKELMHTEERSIKPLDLFNLLAMDEKNILPELKKISYGWGYDSLSQIWTNSRATSSIKIVGNKLMYATIYDMGTNYLFLKELDKTEFKRMSQSKSVIDVGMFESEDYSIIQQIVNKEQMFIITTVIKKHKTKSKKI